MLNEFQCSDKGFKFGFSLHEGIAKINRMRVNFKFFNNLES